MKNSRARSNHLSTFFMNNEATNFHEVLLYTRIQSSNGNLGVNPRNGDLIDHKGEIGEEIAS